MNITVSGATGLIGAAVAQRSRAGSQVKTLGRREPATMIADFSRPDTVEQLSLGGTNAIVHCAGVVDEDFTGDPARAFTQATAGMAAFVDRARTDGVSRFVYISSAHVYGRLTGVIDENTPPNPLSDYALAHFASEQILRRATGPGFRGLVIRPCAVFGIPPNIREFRRWGLIPFSFPRSAARSGQISLKSSGAQWRNFVGVDDIADDALQWLSQPDPHHMSVLNSVGKEDLSVLQFAQLCAEEAKRRVAHEVVVKRGKASPANLDATFEYRTICPSYRRRQDLRATVGALIDLLVGLPDH